MYCFSLTNIYSFLIGLFFIFVIMSTLSSVDLCPVGLTDGAVREIRRLMQSEAITADKGLRIGVKGGGCAGFSYITAFDTPGPTDQVFDVEGIRLIIDPLHELYLKGTRIDFEQGLNNRGFTYQNPNASKTCGCGSSFS